MTTTTMTTTTTNGAYRALRGLAGPEGITGLILLHELLAEYLTQDDVDRRPRSSRMTS